MWTNLIRAEYLKVMGNRRSTGCMVWIFPILGAIFIGLIILISALDSDLRNSIQTEGVDWREYLIVPWVIPNNPYGRALMLAFTAVIFGGEYQYNTWKSIVPRSKRLPLILIKFFTVAYFVLLVFIVTGIVLTIGGLLISVLLGADFGPSLGNAELGKFAEDYSGQMLLAFVSMIVSAGYAALAAMVTRSILGSLIMGMIMTVGEALLILPLYLISALLNAPNVLHMYRFLPTYNLLNMFGWIFEDEAIQMEIGDKMISDPLSFSVGMLVVWVVGLVSLTAYLFQRQDIVN